MKSVKTMAAVVALAFAAASTSTWACDKEKSCCKKNKAARTASATLAKDGRSDTGDAAKTPCAHAAKSTETKSACGKKCDENCAKSCPHAKSRLAAMAEADKPCLKRDKVSAILASLPEMSYRVGDETTSCSKHARTLAAKGGSVQYVVGDESFSAEDEAAARITSLIEEEVNKLQAVHFVVANEEFLCPMSAKNAAKKSKSKVAYRVAGFDFAERAQADEVVERAKEAVSGVKMSYKVGDASFCCDRMAGATAKKTNKSIVYEVAGESTPCAVTAKRLMAEAKLRAFVDTTAEQAGM